MSLHPENQIPSSVEAVIEALRIFSTYELGVIVNALAMICIERANTATPGNTNHDQWESTAAMLRDAYLEIPIK